MGRVADVSPKNMTNRPIREYRMDLDQSPNTRTRMDPLSDLFGSMSIQEAVYKRLEATAPWGVHYSGDRGPRIRFILVVRGSALLRFKNPRRTFSLACGDLFISILSYEPFTLMDHLRSSVVDSSEVLRLEVNGVIHFGAGGPPAHNFGVWSVWPEYIRGPTNFYDSASSSAPAARTRSKSRLPIRTGSFGGRNRSARYSFLVLDQFSL